MTLFSDRLYEIQEWLQSNYPEAANGLKDGISEEKISRFLDKFPFKVNKSIDLLELYKWSRGTSEGERNSHNYVFSPFEPMALSDLQYALENASYLDGEFEEEKIRYADNFLLPIFDMEGSYLCLLQDNHSYEESPLVYVSDICEVSTQYESLAGMIFTMAECLRTGVASISNSPLIQPESFRLIYDHEQLLKIYKKYNPLLPSLVIKRIKKEVSSIYDKENFVCFKIFSDCLGEILLLKKNWRNITIIDNEVADLIAGFIHDNADDPSCLVAKQILDEIQN